MENIIGYVALFELIDGAKYFVSFPDLPGCLTQGDSLEKAICNAQEALAIYYQNKKGELPAASDFISIQNQYPDVITQLIAINTKKYIAKSLRTVKKTLTIPEWLNLLAEKYQVNFSQVLKNALIEHLKNLNSITAYDKRMLDG